MPQQDYFILMGIGGLFIILGLAAVIWGKKEEQSYYDSIAARPGDAREFMDHWPPRLQPGALKVGGWIALSIGVTMLATGGILALLN